MSEKDPAGSAPVRQKGKGGKRQPAPVAEIDIGQLGANVRALAAQGLRQRDLLEIVTAASGVHRQSARPVIEATLLAIGAALDGGTDVIVPPLGKLRVKKQKGSGAERVLSVKIRRGAGRGADPAAPASAEAERQV